MPGGAAGVLFLRMADVEYFESHDLWECAYLRASGAVLEGTRRTGDRVIFRFGDRARCEELSLRYINNGDVPVSTLRSSYADLRRLVFQQ